MTTPDTLADEHQAGGRRKGASPPPEERPRAGSRAARRIRNPVWLKPLVFVLALVPFAWLLYAFWSDLYRGTRVLGSEPITESEHFTGKWALRFLIVSLAITPAIRWLKVGWLIKYRRMLGLFAFFYACVHLTLYFTLDVELRWDLLVEDVLERLYITLGMTALLLLIPVAITSTKGWIRRLGNARWNALHRLVYVSVVLGIIHFYMAVKRDVREPLLYAVIIAVLFGARWAHARRHRDAARLDPARR
jgi:sulfoxide reductase heme-binding subunit YedZ